MARNLARALGRYQTPMWISLDSQQAIDDMLEQFDGFHDGCLREASLASETFVSERGAMSCPGHLDTSALLYFQSQSERLPGLEVRCTGVSHFRLRPTGDNCDSIIASGRYTGRRLVSTGRSLSRWASRGSA